MIHTTGNPIRNKQHTGLVVRNANAPSHELKTTAVTRQSYLRLFASIGGSNHPCNWPQSRSRHEYHAEQEEHRDNECPVKNGRTDAGRTERSNFQRLQ